MAGWWTASRQKEAYDYLVNIGRLSPYGAAGLVSRWANVESTAAGASAINPSSKAFGIAQWLGARKIPISGNTNFQAQLAYVVRELSSTEARAGAVLRAAMTASEGARGASMYERAEGYNGATGLDNWTARTGAGVPAVLAVVGGGGLPPPDLTQRPPTLPANSPTSVADDAGGLATVSEGEAGILSGSGLLLLIGGLALWYVLSD